MMSNRYPRLTISGLSGDSGKTVLSAGFLYLLAKRGLDVQGFKKGPDYIDSAWLSLASSKPARNLDTYLMGSAAVIKSFVKNGSKEGINVIEGNRGLYDGADSKGTHSTAELAKLLNSPVIIIQNITKVTRTAAASILGCKNLDPNLIIAGVILNQAAGERHKNVAKEAIEDITGIPVIGTLPKLNEKFVLPSRHLGLITPAEFEKKSAILNDLSNIIDDHLDINKIIKIAKSAGVIEFEDKDRGIENFISENEKVQIGYFKDQTFTFYYPENLEMLTAAGAELIPISSVDNKNVFNQINALYIGGGFPETNLTNLSMNKEMINSIKLYAEKGLPIYAECGGLMYLSKDIVWHDDKYTLSGVLPIRVKMEERPQGHGYCEALVDNTNPYFEIGTAIKGHEFHYSKIYDHDSSLQSSLSLSRGVGCFDKRDGLIYKNVFASYMHTHALSTPEWISGFMKCARAYQLNKESSM